MEEFITFTDKRGKKVTILLYTIAEIHEEKNGTKIITSGLSYNFTFGGYIRYFFKVQESYAEIIEKIKQAKKQGE